VLALGDLAGVRQAEGDRFAEAPFEARFGDEGVRAIGTPAATKGVAAPGKPRRAVGVVSPNECRQPAIPRSVKVRPEKARSG
jgi:hypothetical protein